jgi:hypothetical protein
MKYIAMVWQRIHFNVFEFNKFTQIKVFGAPIFLLLKNRYVRKSYHKRGVSDPWKIIKQTLIDPKNSIIARMSDIFMCLLVILIFFTLANFLSACFKIILMAQLNQFFFVAIGLVSSIPFNYYVLWRNDQYLTYFKKYEKEPKSVKRKWAFISFVSIVSIVLLLILSFWVMTIGVHSKE